MKRRRLNSFRKKSHNYYNGGVYFISMDIFNRRHLFSNISDNRVELSNIGKIAENIWKKIPEKFLNVRLDEYVIMPDHMHGILIIDKKKGCDKSGMQGRDKSGMQGRDKSGPYGDDILRPNVGAGFILPSSGFIPSPSDDIPSFKNLPNNGGYAPSNNPMGKNGVPEIIRWFKGRSTFEIRKIDKSFRWHRKYYDVIIEDLRAFYYIRNYIQKNPLKWEGAA